MMSLMTGGLISHRQFGNCSVLLSTARVPVSHVTYMTKCADICTFSEVGTGRQV